MEIRPTEAGDRPALSRFFERIPESDRTFLKEDVGDPARREELRLPGGHVTFGTGRSAFKHTMPKLTAWIIDPSDKPS